MVLSRRSGRIREVVQLDKLLAERQFGDADLERHQRHLWTLMRDEARAADAELINVRYHVAICGAGQRDDLVARTPPPRVAHMSAPQTTM